MDIYVQRDGDGERTRGGETCLASEDFSTVATRRV